MEAGPTNRRTLADRRRTTRHSSRGPLVFLLLAAALVAGVLFVARPVAENVIVGLAQERDGMLRQSFVRALVAPRVADQLDRPASDDAEARNFNVPLGATVASIGRSLEQERFVSSAFAFVFLVYETGREGALQSGTYRLSSAMTPRQIASLFERAPGEQAVLTAIEGWRLTEIAAQVARTFPGISPEQFIAAAVVGARTAPSLRGLEPSESLEGYLFPETYFFRPEATAADIVGTMLDTFESRVGTTLREAAAARGVTVYDLVALASIVEREARRADEAATIAGVYVNRLRIGMKLDADPTVQYALGDWRELTLQDLESASPYNTYRTAGLPPTPIANPGQNALEAAARPAAHDYLFFVAKMDGSGGHVFARTLEEHEENRVKVGNR